MSTKTKNWTEEDFRRELRKIDRLVAEKQGLELDGASLPIEFSIKARRTYGLYYPQPKKFRFSLHFFNSDVPEECAVDVIRHEYAHYYNDVVFGISYGHGTEFKVACQIVGAKPGTYYTREFEKNARSKEEHSLRAYSTSFQIGQCVLHPSFGDGIVLSIKEQKETALLTIDFGDNGIRCIDENWLKNKGAY